MKLYRIQTNDGPRIAIGYGDLILDAAKIYEQAGENTPEVILRGDMRSICAAPDVVVVFLADVLQNLKTKIGEDHPAVMRPRPEQILAPLPNPAKFICVGLNYADHCDEQNKPHPPHPVLFSKFNNAIVGPHDNILKTDVTNQLDWEAELGVVIGLGGRKISREDAYSHIFGYTAINDVSARDLQKADGQFFRAKSQDTYAPMGPCIVTTHEISDPGNLKISSRVNGATMQDSTTANLIFDIPTLIEFISEGITLEPGDIISTGTPAGVGIHRTPPIVLGPGDEVEVAIEGIGILRNRVVGES